MILNQSAPPLKAEKVAEGGHWYENRNGVWFPIHEPGGTFNLRNARVLKAEGKLVAPSVTGIFKMLNKKQITDWLIKGAVLATLTIDRRQFADDDDWADACAARSQARSDPAKALGTRVHDAIEAAVIGKEYDADLDIYVQPVLQQRGELGMFSIAAESCVGSLEEGYAGRCDDLCENFIVGDYKTRQTKPGKKITGYETEPMQLAAYGVARWGAEFLKKGTGVNFIISSTEPGRVEHIMYNAEHLARAYDAFLGLNACWRYSNKFDPRSQMKAAA